MIAVLRERHDETSWAGVMDEAHRRARRGGAVMAALPATPTPTLIGDLRRLRGRRAATASASISAPR